MTAPSIGRLSQKGRCCSRRSALAKYAVLNRMQCRLTGGRPARGGCGTDASGPSLEDARQALTLTRSALIEEVARPPVDW